MVAPLQGADDQYAFSVGRFYSEYRVRIVGMNSEAINYRRQKIVVLVGLAIFWFVRSAIQ